MHVLFIHQAFPAQFGRLALELTKRHGWRCSFLIQALADCPTPSPEMLQRCELHFVPLPEELRAGPTSWFGSYAQSLQWCEAIAEAVRCRPGLRPDLVVAYGPVGTPTLFLPEVLDCPLIQYCEYYYGPRRDVSYRIDLPPVALAPFPPRSMNAIALENLVTCAGGYAPTHWQRGTFPPRFRDKIEVHFDGIDTELYQPRPKPRALAGRSVSPETRVVTFVTRGLESMRGFDLFLRLAQRIQREWSDVLFVVVGNDKNYYGRDRLHTGQPSFKEWVLRQGEYDLSRFVFFGHVEPEQLAEILARSDLHVYLTVPFVPSWSLLNALACGCVVLASDVEPVREFIQPGQNGLLEPLFDTDRLAETALRVLREPEAFRPLGEAGRRLVEEQYSVDVAVPELKDYFERKAAATATPRPPAPPRRLLLQTLLAVPETSEVRVAEPVALLATLPGVRTVIHTDRFIAFNAAQPGEEKIVILQRVVMGPKDVPKVREMLQRGYAIVVEMDDDPLRWPVHTEDRFFTFRSCHGIQTSTEPLAAFLRQFNPHVAVFPNQIASLPPPRSYPDAGPVTLFFGALNREEDWKPILPALNRVLAEYGNRVHVRVIYDRLFFEALQTEAKEFQPWCPYERYLEVLRSCDVGLLPLQPTRFNRMKSDLKFLQCAAQGVAALASPTVYENSILDGDTGFLYRSADEFADKLRRLLDDPALRHRLAGRAYQWVCVNRRLVQHYHQRYTWYVQLRDALPQLNAELKQRTPELGLP